jgi:hypothetical protein
MNRIRAMYLALPSFAFAGGDNGHDRFLVWYMAIPFARLHRVQARNERLRYKTSAKKTVKKWHKSLISKKKPDIPRLRFSPSRR